MQFFSAYCLLHSFEKSLSTQSYEVIKPLYTYKLCAPLSSPAPHFGKIFTQTKADTGSNSGSL
jgi:hypothetical protein